MSQPNLFLEKAYLTKDLIFGELVSFLHSQEKLGKIHPLAKNFLASVEQYSQRGKGIRGILVARGYEWFGGSSPAVRQASLGGSSPAIRQASLGGTDPSLLQASYKIGAAVELLQGGFLIHDDIIDQDDVRRGQPAMHKEFEQLVDAQKWSNPIHSGESLAIIAGDFCFFWMNELIAGLDIPAEIRLKLITTLAREAVHTGVGEAVDVALSMKPLADVSTAELELVNRYKTARYTISLPLLLAAHLAGVPEKYLERIALFGEVVGDVFQLRDDELGLFGTSKEIGKPVGSDIREGKRTIWWCELLERCSDEEREKLLKLSGNKDITEADVEWVKALVLSTGTDQVMKSRIEELKTKAYELMSQLPVSDSCQQEVQDAVSYIIDRQK